MAMTIPAGDPGLSQDATQAGMSSRNRTQRMQQFMGGAAGGAAPLMAAAGSPQASSTRLGQLYADVTTPTPTSTQTAPRYQNFAGGEPPTMT